MSNFHSDKPSNQTSTPAETGGIPFNRNGQRSMDTAERMRRLIPYMTFYIPTSSRDYLPTSPYAPVNKPMVIKTHFPHEDDARAQTDTM